MKRIMIFAFVLAVVGLFGTIGRWRVIQWADWVGERPEAVQRYVQAKIRERQMDRMITCINKKLMYSTATGAIYSPVLDQVAISMHFLSTPEVILDDNPNAVSNDFNTQYRVVVRCALEVDSWGQLFVLDYGLKGVDTLDDGLHFTGIAFVSTTFPREIAQQYVDGDMLLSDLIGSGEISLMWLSSIFYQTTVPSASVKPELILLAVERWEARNAKAEKIKAEAAVEATGK